MQRGCPWKSATNNKREKIKKETKTTNFVRGKACLQNVHMKPKHHNNLFTKKARKSGEIQRKEIKKK